MSVCLRSKRSEVRILSGVPVFNNLADAAQPDSANSNKNSASFGHRLATDAAQQERARRAV